MLYTQKKHKMNLHLEDFDEVYLDSFLILEITLNNESNYINGSMEIEYDRKNDSISCYVYDVKYIDGDENIIRLLTKEEKQEVQECIVDWFTGREEDYFSDNSDFNGKKSKRYEYFE